MPLIIDGVEIPIEVSADGQSIKKTADGLDSLIKKGDEPVKQYDKRKAKAKEEADAVKAAEAAKQKAMEQTIAKMNKQREQMEKLVQVGSMMAASGAAIFGGLVLAAKNYASQADEADQIAQRWRDSTDRLTDAQMQLGRAVARELNPAYEKLAEIMERVSSAAEGSRTGTSTAIGLGASLLAGGTILATMAKLSSMLAGLGTVTGSAAIGGASAAVGGAALPAAVYALAASVGAVIGKAIGDTVNDALGQQRQSWSDVLETAKRTSAIFSPVGLAAQALKEAGFVEGATKLWELAKWMNGIEDAPETVVPNTGRAPGQQLPDTAARGTPEAIARGKAEARRAREERELQEKWEREAEARREKAFQAQEARAQKILDAQKNLANQEIAIRQRMADTTRQFIQAEADAHQDYYNRRSDMARQAGIDAARAEEDHQRRIREILRRGNERVMQAAQQRDALGLVRAKRDMEQERRGEEENYQIEARRRNQDFAERIRQMDRDFAIQRQRRIREYEFKMQAYQAEVAAAQQAYKAIVDAILQMRHALAANNGGRMTGRRNDYSSVANARPTGVSSANANVNINAGALNLSQVREIASQTAMSAAARAMEAAFR